MMKLLYFFMITTSLLIFSSCQKELDDGSNGVSKGYLVKGANQACNQITISGMYKAGKVVNDSNRLNVTVDVTATGNYILHTDTVNGYSFKATGRFTAAGIQTVQLSGTGMPVTAGTNTFTVVYDTSTCEAIINVQANAPPAAYTLAGAPNGCTNAMPYGTFAQGVLLDTSSGVTITLLVTTPGSYNIATNTVNGYSFSGTGQLTATGLQTVRLQASGTPVSAGTHNFAITVGAATCTFPVTTVIPVAVNSADYFPLTTGSYWVYNDLFNTGDSLRREITDSVITNGNLYKKMTQQQAFYNQQYLFRKTGTDYVEYGQVNRYTSSFTYSPVIENDLLFLKTNISTGTTWQSPEYSGTASFGQTILLRYNYICEQANTAVTINGNVVANVHKILMYPEIRSVGNAWGLTNEYYTYYYAKGIGLIYARKLTQGFTIFEMAIRRWQIN